MAEWKDRLEVQLSPAELEVAALVGSRRQVEALRRGLPDAHGFDGEDGWSVHIEGACAELAVARVSGRYWGATVNTFKAGADIGANLQVRRRRYSWHDLIIRPDDRDEDVYVLVVGRNGTYGVVGWCFGKDARRPEWLKEYGGRPAAHFVAQSALRFPAELGVEDHGLRPGLLAPDANGFYTPTPLRCG